MPLAYTFWHRPRLDVGAYERDLGSFHLRLAAVPIPGFIASRTLRVPDLPWLPGGGYEDWYVIDDFAALGRLATAAVDPDRAQAHDALAGAVDHGAGGVYALVAGRLSEPPGWCGWFRKRAGVRYPDLLAELRERADAGAVVAAWQRQLVLGPAEEFRLEAPGPVSLSGAELVVGVQVAVSG